MFCILIIIRPSLTKVYRLAVHQCMKDAVDESGVGMLMGICVSGLTGRSGSLCSVAARAM